MNHTLKTILLVLAVSVATSAVTLNMLTPQSRNSNKDGSESVYDRVMRTRTIRCGYFVWPPYVTKDPNSGTFSGLYVDFMDALATVADLKIEWAQELNFGTYLEDLTAGRYDMECAGGWPNAMRGQKVFYGKPYAFVPYVALVRQDDRRFDDNPAAINKSDVKVATMDGETTSVLRRLRFPQTQDVSLPQNAPFTDVILNVAGAKADITFADALTASQFVKENPGKARTVTYATPLYLISLSPTLPPDIRLKQMIDVATDQLLNSGAVEVILRKYETEPGLFLRSAGPYEKKP